MKKYLLFLLIILSTGSLLSQEGKITDNLSFKLTYGNVNSKQIIPFYSNETTILQETFYRKNSQYGFEGLYRMNKYLVAGVYFGYSNGTFISNEILSTEQGGYSATIDRFGRSFYYGIKSEIQLLPLLINTERLRISVYCPIQVGLVSQSITTNETYITNWDKPALELGGGLGIAYNFTRNIGIFGEYELGHFFNKRNSQWKTGLVISF